MELFFNKFYYIVIVVVVVLCIIGFIFVIIGGVMLFKIKDCELIFDEELKWIFCDYFSEV